MQSPWLGKIIGIYHDPLPHWIVNYGCYAVTIRCHGTLPKYIVTRLHHELEESKDITPKSHLAHQERNKSYHILDNYLDRGFGYAPFYNTSIAIEFSKWLSAYNHDEISFDSFVVMPNHIHLITKPITVNSIEEFTSAIRRFKARSARLLNQRLQRNGTFWQKSWYDRWIRNEPEWHHWANYIKNNPVSANLIQNDQTYPAMKISTTAPL
jgi:REP element-mobilizing transposase RayT